MTESSVLVDTNVLAYAYDRSAQAKQLIALEVLKRLHRLESGLLTTQVLGELFEVLTKKLPEKFTPEVAQKRLENYLLSWTVLPITPFIVREALRGVIQHKLSYWDAQVWASARLNQLSLVLTEDFSDGLTLEGVSFINPFSKRFDLNLL